MPMAYSATGSAVTTACLAIPCAASLKNAKSEMALPNRARLPKTLPAQPHRLTIRHGATAPARAANVTSPGPGKSVTAPMAIMPMAYSPAASTATTACLAIPWPAPLKNAKSEMALPNRARLPKTLPAQPHRLTIRHGATAPARAANVTSPGPGKSVTAPTVIIPMAYSPTAPAVTTACLATLYMATLRPARLKMARRNPRQPRPTRSAHDATTDTASELLCRQKRQQLV